MVTLAPRQGDKLIIRQFEASRILYLRLVLHQRGLDSLGRKIIRLLQLLG